MRLPKSKLGKAIAIAIAIYGTRLAIKSAGEWARYDRIRAMSDEPPLATEIPRLLLDTAIEERAAISEWGQFFFKFPIEMARYLKMESL